MITMYETEWCPDSHRIRQLMTELRLTYTAVNVAESQDERPEVVAVSGQAGVPVLVDGDKVFVEPDDAMEYLRETYPRADDADRQAMRGAWRRSKELSVPPRVAHARLAELLLAQELSIVSQLKGPQIDPHLPEEYVLLHVGAPAAIARSFELDPRAPVALVVPIAVVPAEGGNSIVAMADPVGQVWLYGENPLRRVQMAVKKRLLEVLQEL